MKPYFYLLLLAAGISWGGPEASLETQFGTRDFIEYQTGRLPIVIAVPHGGRERPEDILDRTTGVTAMDANTQELGREIAEQMKRRTSELPHLVVCHLHRSKLDANRDVSEAAQGSEAAEVAWREHHAFIEKACQTAVAEHGFAFLIDLHGHSHPEARVELGYLHSPEDLADCPDRIAGGLFAEAGSLAWMAERVSGEYADLLHGRHSLGALLEERGFLATPSPRMPVPSMPFFRGGYTVARHCKAELKVVGVQIEANRPKLRDTAENRLRFAEALCSALDAFLICHLQVGMLGRESASSPSKNSLKSMR